MIPRWCGAVTTLGIFLLGSSPRPNSSLRRRGHSPWLMALGRGGSAMVVGTARIAPGPFLQLGTGGKLSKKPSDRRIASIVATALAPKIAANKTSPSASARPQPKSSEHRERDQAPASLGLSRALSSEHGWCPAQRTGFPPVRCIPARLYPTRHKPKRVAEALQRFPTVAVPVNDCAVSRCLCKEGNVSLA
jgi:hypothetical protein